MELYISTIRKWAKHIFKQPQEVMFLSILFIVFSLPLITIGVSAALCIYIAKLNSEGRVYKLKDIILNKLKTMFFKSLVMGFIDICLLALSILCVTTLIRNDISMIYKPIYAMYLSIDLICIISAMYRYPILVCNENIGVIDIFLTGLLLTIKNLLICILFTLVLITVIIVSVLTGVGIFLILPGAVSLLFIYIYKQSLFIETGTL